MPKQPTLVLSAGGFQLPLDAITETFGILAVRGAGKSNTGAVMAEEMHKAGLPFVVIDPVGSWWGLRSSKDGKGPGLPIPIFGGKHGDVPLERGGGELVADLIAEQRLSCVLDLTMFDSESAKKQFLLDFARRLYRQNEQPLHLFLEEADDYIPQRPMGDEAHLLRAWENIVRRGRARGLGMTVITQRSASLNKNVLTQVQTLIAMRTTGPQDRKAIEEWVKYHGQSREILESLPGLRDGEAWVWSPDFLRTTVRVRFRQRSTFDSGATPKAGVTGTRAPATLADVDLGTLTKRMAATIEKAKLTDPKALRQEVDRLRRELAHVRKVDAPLTRVEVQIEEKPVLTDKQIEQLHSYIIKLGSISNEVIALGNEIGTAIAKVRDYQRGRPAAGRYAPQGISLSEAVKTPPRPSQPRGRHTSDEESVAGDLAPPQQKILDAVRWLESVNVTEAARPQVAFLANQSSKSSAFERHLAAVEKAGLIYYPRPGYVGLTEAGRYRAAAPDTPLTTEQLQETIIDRLPPPQGNIVRTLAKCFPGELTRDELARETNQSATSSAFERHVAAVEQFGFVRYPRAGAVVATEVLFLNGHA